MAHVRQPELLGDFLALGALACPDAPLLARADPRHDEKTDYAAFAREVRALAAGLLEVLGLEPGDRVAVFADNSRRWLLADQALATAGLVSVPRGTDSAPSELERIVEHSGAKLVLHDKKLRLETGVDSRTLDDDGLCDLLEAGHAHIETDEGKSLLDRVRPTPDALCTIVYTSGTTGKPKGVMLTHANLVSNVLAVNEALPFRVRGTMLSILPSWHMFERIFEYVSISRCCCIVYTDTRRITEDLKTFRPDIVAFVPRIWELLAGGMQKKLDKLTGAKGFLVRRVRGLGRRACRPGSSTWLRRLHAKLARKLLAPVHAALGGNLKLGASGGGALPEEVDRLLLELGVPLVNGYGLTETSPCLSVRTPDGNRVQSIGPPLPRTEMRVVRDGAVLGADDIGEIQARGPQIMRGYYCDDEATRKVLDDEGWFRTGDLGSFDRDRWFRITGRIKDTIVLAGGENVEPEPIECRLKTSPWIDQVMLVGQDQKVLGALVVVNDEHCRDELGRETDPTSDEVQNVVRKEIDGLLTLDRGFRKIDRVGRFAILREPFSTDDGTMTATLKLRRHVIQKRYAEEIESLYV